MTLNELKQMITNDYNARQIRLMNYELHIYHEDDLVTILIGNNDWYCKYTISRACYDDEVDYQVYGYYGYNNKRTNITRKMPSLKSFEEYVNTDYVFASYGRNCLQDFVSYVHTFKY